jgi:phosphoribosylpyrophosphate synthetase
MRKRGCIVSKLLAKMMCKSGLTHVITMDLHQKEIQGFFDCPVDNLRASPFLLQYIQECVSGYVHVREIHITLQLCALYSHFIP